MKATYKKNELEVINRIIMKVCVVAGITPKTYQEYQKANAEKSKGLTIITETEDEFTVESRNDFAVDILKFVEKCVDKLVPVVGMFRSVIRMATDQLEDLGVAFVEDVMMKYEPQPEPGSDPFEAVLDALRAKGIKVDVENGTVSQEIDKNKLQ